MSPIAGDHRKIEAAKQHIDDIRKRKFSIGEKIPNPLTEDLHNAVTSLSSELYSKDVHFLMELIQNAEDNEYLEGVQPTLEFVITSKDITGVGAPATLLVFNNEIGFSKANIDSLCSVGRSTKKGRRVQGFIGEKGIGFKSVFLVSAWPYIFSNGYQIRFSEVPNEDCSIGYIVPEWIAAKPTVSDLQSTYGSNKTLPGTTIILPLKPAKLEAVREELSKIHPEVLLFLHKIKRLSVRENSGASCLADTVSAISISSETNLISSRTQGADSRIVHLSVHEEADTAEAKCHYFIHRQVFPVNPLNVVDSRKDLKEWVVSLAFPFGDRLKIGTSSVGIFAFLPTAMVTNFPFIVQADFILASSREAILLDNKWNSGILDIIPASYVCALTTCMESPETAKFFSIARILEFLPARESSIKELNNVRESIRVLVQSKCIVPCEPFSTEQMVFCKPSNAIRILLKFREILCCIKELSGPISGISSQGKFVLHNSMDHEIYDEVLDFLGVQYVGNYDWYGKCIKKCNLMSRASADVYVELLFFLADNSKNLPLRTLHNIPLLKYNTWNGDVSYSTILQIRKEQVKVHLAWEAQEHAWLNKWNLGMRCPDDTFFFPDVTVTTLLGHERRYYLKNWLISKVGVVITDVSTYCSKLFGFLGMKKDPKLALSLSHLVYHSFMKNYIQVEKISGILQYMPVVDRSGNVSLCMRCLMPAFKSEWVKLLGSADEIVGEFELRSNEREVQHEPSDYLTDDEYEANCCGLYAELGEVYAEAAEFAGECTPQNELLNLLVKHGKVTDLPDILPQDLALQVASTQLTCDQALLLLDWIRNLRAKKYCCQKSRSMRKKYQIPMKFIESIRSGKWMKAYSGFRSPPECYLYNGTKVSTLLEMGKALKALSAVDEEYYADKIGKLKDELMFIGVQMGTENTYQLLIDHFRHLVSSPMSGNLALLLLTFVRYAKDNNKLDEDFLKTLQDGKWMKTNHGYVNPIGSVFLTTTIRESVSQITDLNVVDITHYGHQLSDFVDELKLLGVVVHMEDVHKLILEHFRFPNVLTDLPKDAVFLLLKCIRRMGPTSACLAEKIKCQPWMKTISSGYRCPSESILSNHKWGDLVKIVPLPIIDETYYGSKIASFKAELETIGVTADLAQASDIVTTKLKSLVSSSSLSADIVISLLNYVKCVHHTMPSQMSHIISCLSGEKWLKTSQGYKYATDSILFDSKWGTISKYVDLPLIDVTFYGVKILLFKDELKMLGVVVNFDEGVQFVARGLKLPTEPLFVLADTAHSLLYCVMSVRKSNLSSDESLLERFFNRLRGSKWLKTHMGYRSPEESLLFDPDWKCYLEECDGPFLDQSFYGTFDTSETDALKFLGVKTDTKEVGNMIVHDLTSHSETSTVLRIYRFLNKFKWSPNSREYYTSHLWVPDQDGTCDGRWVYNWVCVLHDGDNLFGSFLNVLDKYYDEDILPFLSTFGVDKFPNLYRYMDLWNNWVRTKHDVSSVELNSFWGYISENWNYCTEKTLKRSIEVLPATTASGSLHLVKRKEVFIPDDLQLKRSLTEASAKPLFVWYPQNGFSSPTKLYEIYRCLGVQKISEAVQISVNGKFEKMGLEDSVIGRPLIKIVLAFLANPLICMPVEERHMKANSLIDILIFGTEKLIVVGYSLELPSLNEKLHVEIRKRVLWDKSSQRLILHKPSWKNRQKDIEFINNFARAIAEAVLPSGSDLVDSLCKIIKMGVVFGFKEDMVDSLLVAENLELSAEDKKFLDCVFLCVKLSSPVSKNDDSIIRLESPCTPETPLCKRPRKN